MVSVGVQLLSLTNGGLRPPAGYVFLTGANGQLLAGANGQLLVGRIS